MKYKVELTRTAEKQLESIPKSDVKKIAKRIDKLVIDPFPNGSEKLKGAEDTYRIRQGDYRILYSVFEKTLVILVFKISHRREVYRDL